MRQLFSSLAATAVVAFALLVGTAVAQAPPKEGAVKQIKLTEKQVQGFIAGHKEIAALADKPGPGTDAKLEAAARKAGFASIAEYDDVEANILMVFDGIDPDTKAFTEPPALIKKRIEEFKADKAASEKEKKEGLADLTEGAQDRAAHSISRQRRTRQKVSGEDRRGHEVARTTALT